MTESIARPDPTGGSDWDPFENLVDVLATATRYDFALGSIPCAFAVALVVANVTSVSVVQAFAPAVFVALGVIVDALYVNPPIDRDEGPIERAQ